MRSSTDDKDSKDCICCKRVIFEVQLAVEARYKAYRKVCTRIILLEGNAVLLKPQGRFSVWQGIHIWESYQPDASPFNSYVFDLENVSNLSASGRTWLHWFLRWANTAHIHVTIVNVPDNDLATFKSDVSLAPLYVSPGAKEVNPLN